MGGDLVRIWLKVARGMVTVYNRSIYCTYGLDRKMRDVFEVLYDQEIPVLKCPPCFGRIGFIVLLI